MTPECADKFADYYAAYLKSVAVKEGRAKEVSVCAEEVSVCAEAIKKIVRYYTQAPKPEEDTWKWIGGFFSAIASSFFNIVRDL
jgi:hypothetical protein